VFPHAKAIRSLLPDLLAIAQSALHLRQIDCRNSGASRAIDLVKVSRRRLRDV